MDILACPCVPKTFSGTVTVGPDGEYADSDTATRIVAQEANKQAHDAAVAEMKKHACAANWPPCILIPTITVTPRSTTSTSPGYAEASATWTLTLFCFKVPMPGLAAAQKKAAPVGVAKAAKKPLKG